MKEIQEKRLENELKFIKESSNEITKKIIKLNTNSEYQIEITIPPSLSKCSNDIKLLLLVSNNYPFNPPKLYFISKFSFPHLCDGRDVLEDILETTWLTQYKLIDIINKIPKFILDYTKSLNEGFLILAGNFYLGAKYDLDFLEKLPVFTKRVKEKEILFGKYVESNKLLVISDLYFCLYEIDKKNKNKGELTFWSNIKALITIKRIVKENICIFIWRNKFDNKKEHEIYIVIPHGEEVVNLMISKMESFGIKYNISQKTIGPKEGKLPSCDIEMVEKEIEEYEKKINQNDVSVEMVQYLILLYERAIEYYSAINNPRYEHFMKKTKECMNMNIMIDNLNKVNQSNENKTHTEDSVQKAEMNTTSKDNENNKQQIEDKKDNNNKEDKQKEKEDKNGQPLSSREKKPLMLENLPKETEDDNKPKSSRSLHVAMSNDEDDAPIDVGSGEDEEEEDD